VACNKISIISYQHLFISFVLSFNWPTILLSHFIEYVVIWLIVKCNEIKKCMLYLLPHSLKWKKRERERERASHLIHNCTEARTQLSPTQACSLLALISYTFALCNERRKGGKKERKTATVSRNNDFYVFINFMSFWMNNHYRNFLSLFFCFIYKEKVLLFRTKTSACDNQKIKKGATEKRTFMILIFISLPTISFFLF
jgi:hypothetical protein